MSDNEKTVPIFVEKESGEKVQVGWATPEVNGARKVNLFEEYNNTAIRDVKFGDVEPFETTIDPTTTQAEPRTFEEFASQPFVDIEGEVIEPALNESPDFDPGNGVTVITPQEPSEDELEVGGPLNTPNEETPLPTQPVEDAPNEEQAAEPIDAGVAPEDSEPIENAPEEEEVVEATIEPDEVEDDSDDAEDVPEGSEPVPAGDPEQVEDSTES